MRVVVVDDDRSTALLIALELHQAGIEAIQCTDHFESLPTSVDWEEIDAVIVDNYLGFFDGRTILGWLEREHPTIRRIMLTGDTRIEVKSTHAHILLTKPAQADVILGALNGG